MQDCLVLLDDLQIQDRDGLDDCIRNNGKGLDCSMSTIERLSKRALELVNLKVRHHNVNSHKIIVI